MMTEQGQVYKIMYTDENGTHQHGLIVDTQISILLRSWIQLGHIVSYVEDTGAYLAQCQDRSQVELVPIREGG